MPAVFACNPSEKQTNKPDWNHELLLRGNEGLTEDTSIYPVWTIVWTLSLIAIHPVVVEIFHTGLLRFSSRWTDGWSSVVLHAASVAKIKSIKYKSKNNTEELAQLQIKTHTNSVLPAHLQSIPSTHMPACEGGCSWDCRFVFNLVATPGVAPCDRCWWQTKAPLITH